MAGGRRDAHHLLGVKGTNVCRGLPRGAGYLQNKTGATVIVVDNDVSVRRALGRQLQILGFEVLVFPSAEELLASRFPTDNACLLLDVYMPEMSGIELCQNLVTSGRRLPTVLMSGRDDQETRQIMRQAKPVACLFKPFDEKSLLGAIRKGFRSTPH
jgi:FixJ family two-component response regulator